MEKGKNPNGREKEVLSGTAHVGKGEQVNTGGQQVGGGRPGGPAPRQENRAGGQKSSGLGTAAAVGGGIWLLSKLPKKYRPIVIVILAIIVIAALAKGCGADTAQEDYYSSAPVVTQAPTPVPTAVPTAAATATPTQAPAATAAPAAVTNTAARNYYTSLKGNGQDTVTVMIYICGTDLESNYGMATSDLNEMLQATAGSNVKIIVETGGCKKWKNNVISNSVNEIYEVLPGQGLNPLKQFNATSMTDPNNLTSFIRFCSQNYPANRNILIFWDHGGGSLTGYGYDEKFTSSSSMTLSKINTALSNAGVKFDWIGFDACLMATLETDLVCEKYADYIIASEESEPGTGWYYTNWVTQLSRNPSIATTELSKTIIDDFVTTSCQSASNAQVTLSVVDLAELSGSVPASFKAFSSATTNLAKTNANALATARGGTRQFASSSRLNQIDLIDFCNRLGTAEAKTLADNLSSCIKYNRSTITRSNGVSIYFPYESTSAVPSAVSTYNAIGLDEEYTTCIKTFASLLQGSSVVSSAAYSNNYSSGSYADYSDLLGTLLGGYGGSGYSSSSGGYGGSGYSSSAAGSLLSSLMGGGYTNSYGGQTSGYSVNPADLIGLMSAFSGRSMPAGLEWVDTDVIAENAEQIAENSIDPARIAITEKNGVRTLVLTEEEWANVSTVELNVLVDDGEGYIDLGYDDINFERDADDDLILDWDGTWFTVNGQPAALYLVSSTSDEDGSFRAEYRIPARIQTPEMDAPVPVNLQFVADSANPKGSITGAYPLYADGETDVISKGMIELVAGTEVTLLCDLYDYSMKYDSAYTIGETFTVGAGGLKTGYMSTDASTCLVTFRLTDVFGNYFWTPAFTK